MKISSAVRRSGGIHVRVVQDEKPTPDAVEVEPNLEDAYLHAMVPDVEGRTS